MPFLVPLANEQASPAAQEVFRDLKATRGQVINLYRTLAHAPAVLQATVQLGEATKTTLDARLRELAYLVTSRLNDCHY